MKFLLKLVPEINIKFIFTKLNIKSFNINKNNLFEYILTSIYLLENNCKIVLIKHEISSTNSLYIQVFISLNII